MQSWLYVMNGQGIMPVGYEPLADTLDDRVIENNLDNIRGVVRTCAGKMPSHQQFIDENCSADDAGG